MNYLTSYIGCGLFNALFTTIPMTIQTYKWYDREMKLISDDDTNDQLSRMYFRRFDMIGNTFIMSFSMGFIYTLRICYGLIKSINDPNHIKIINDINYKLPFVKDLDYEKLKYMDQDYNKKYIEIYEDNVKKCGWFYEKYDFKFYEDHIKKYGLLFEKNYLFLLMN